MSDKKQSPKEKKGSSQTLVVETLEFEQLSEAIQKNNPEGFEKLITDISLVRKKPKSTSVPALIQIVQLALRQAINDNQNIDSFVLLDYVKNKEPLLKDLAIYAVRHGKPKSIVPIAKALQELKIHIDSIGIKGKSSEDSPMPLINWSIQQSRNSAVTMALLEAGSQTYTQKGLNLSQQHISKPSEDMGDFPNSLDLAIKCHDPEKNDLSTVISTMISQATPKDISGSINFLEVFRLNKKDVHFAIMTQLLNKSEKAPILAALNLLQETQNEKVGNKEALRVFILECIKQESTKLSWKKLGAACMKLAQSLKEHNIISALQQTKIPLTTPGIWDNLVNYFFSSTSTPGESKGEPLLSLDSKGKGGYGSAESASRPGRGLTLNDED